MSAIIRLMFWLVMVAIVAVTLSPIAFRPETGLPAPIERFVAFLLIGVLGGTAYPQRRLAWMMALVVAAGLLEALQLVVPGRHGRMIDFEIKSAGVLVGGALALIGGRLWQRMSGSGAPRF